MTSPNEATLTALREEAKLTQFELAALSGVNTTTISEIERRVANPTVRTLDALSGALSHKLGRPVSVFYRPKLAGEPVTAKAVNS